MVDPQFPDDEDESQPSTDFGDLSEEFPSPELPIKSEKFEEHFWDNLGTQGAVNVEKIFQMAQERPITHNDVLYLLSQYIFLDICNGDSPQIPDVSLKPTISYASTQWVIYDRGNRLTSGPGRLVYGAYWQQGEVLAEEDEEDDGGSSSEGQWIFADGTLVKQFFDTAIEVMALAASRWPVTMILDGYYPMKRALWMASQELNHSIMNFEPNDEDKVMYQQIKNYTRAFRTPPKIPQPKKR